MPGVKRTAGLPELAQPGKHQSRQKRLGISAESQVKPLFLIKLVKERFIPSIAVYDRAGKRNEPSGRLCGFLRLLCSVGHRDGKEEEKEDEKKEEREGD